MTQPAHATRSSKVYQLSSASPATIKPMVLQRAARAGKCFRAALEKGSACLAQGQVEAAILNFQQATRLAPDDPAGYLNLAVAQRRAQRLESARQALSKARSLAPELPELAYNAGQLEIEAGDLHLALDQFQRAVDGAPAWAEAHNALGTTLLRLGQIEPALAAFDVALTLRPNWNLALHNRGLANQKQGQDRSAIDDYRAAVANGSERWETHNNLAYLLLKYGDFENGFRELEWRFRNGGQTPPRLGRPQPVWQGESLGLQGLGLQGLGLQSHGLQGKTLLLCEEQGAGDMIQFVRYAPILKSLGARVLIEASPSLTRFMANVDGIDGVVDPGQPCPEADLQLPLLSLPPRLNARLDDIPAPAVYKAAGRLPSSKPDLGLDRKLARYRDQLKIGIVWTGDPQNFMNPERSCKPGDFAALAAVPEAAVPGAALFSLQFAPPEEIHRQLLGLPIDSLAEYLGDFADTAEVVKRLDLVITIDTSMAHLAGTLGKEVYLLLHTPTADWRWLPSGSDSPWYPALRIFRQRRPGDWASVFAAVKGALEEKTTRLQGGQR